MNFFYPSPHLSLHDIPLQEFLLCSSFSLSFCWCPFLPMDPLPLFLPFLLLFPPLFFSCSFPFLLKHDFLLFSLSPSQQASPAVSACLLVPPPAVYATLLPSPAALSHTSPTACVTPLTSLPGSSFSRCCCSSSSSFLSCSHHCGFPNL